MLDVSELQRKAELARSMVQRGLASDLEDAYEQINQQNLVKSNESEIFTKRKNVSGTNNTNNESLSESNVKNDNIKEKRNSFNDEVVLDKFKNLDKNISILAKAIGEIGRGIISIDKKIENLTNTTNDLKVEIISIKENAKKNINNISNISNSNSDDNNNDDNNNNDNNNNLTNNLQEMKPNDNSQNKKENIFAVEKIFNNSNNRLTKK